jgi:hypothetical protein
MVTLLSSSTVESEEQPHEAHDRSHRETRVLHNGHVKLLQSLPASICQRPDVGQHQSSIDFQMDDDDPLLFSLVHACILPIFVHVGYILTTPCRPSVHGSFN